MESLNLLYELNSRAGMGKYGRLLGWLYVGDADISLNEAMIIAGYAWEYDGGTKKKTLRNYERYVEHSVHYRRVNNGNRN